MCSPVASGDVASIVLMRTMVRLRRFSSDPTRAARSAIDGCLSQLASQRFARRIQFAALTADAARPRVFSQRVDHRAAHAPFGERLELDAALLVEAVRRVDQAEHAVLNEIADVDRVRHRGGHPPGERFNKGNTGDDAAVLTGGDWLDAHELSWLSRFVPVPSGDCAISQRPVPEVEGCVSEVGTLASLCQLSDLEMVPYSRGPFWNWTGWSRADHRENRPKQ